ncbi:hypothetical protein VIGAN_08324500 [Vigna angularis var. angularis]|uniref:Uncharacterized protein n=1 Tax=Vigna angularis var. angularis TaxID=157739 RepID=A0A0S3SU06_PHAAN|nr:hypothetical protein VIGAN_08324500 [Vigna angularis var. angularis]
MQRRAEVDESNPCWPTADGGDKAGERNAADEMRERVERKRLETNTVSKCF